LSSIHYQESCPRQQNFHILFERFHARIRRARTSYNHEIITRGNPRQLAAYRLAQPALHAIADHRATNTTTHRETDARQASIVRLAPRGVPQEKHCPRNTSALRAHPLKIARRTEPLRASQPSTSPFTS
jgi:hypothetical protein